MRTPIVALGLILLLSACASPETSSTPLVQPSAVPSAAPSLLPLPPITQRSYGPAPSASPPAALVTRNAPAEVQPRPMPGGPEALRALVYHDNALMGASADRLWNYLGNDWIERANLPCDRWSSLESAEGFLLLTSPEAPHIWRSTNGGNAWQSQRPPPGWPLLESARKLITLGADSYLALYSESALFYSSNRASNWRNLFYPKVPLEDFTISEQGQIWAAAGRFGVYNRDAQSGIWSSVWKSAGNSVTSIAWWEGAVYFYTAQGHIYRLASPSTEPELLGQIKATGVVNIWASDSQRLWVAATVGGQVLSYSAQEGWLKWPWEGITDLAASNQGVFILVPPPADGAESSLWQLR